MGDLTDDELSELERNAEHLPSSPTTLREIEPLLDEIGRRRAARTASAEHAAMLLLDGLTGRRSANVFEAARNVEAVIAGIPGRPVVQEPSSRGRDLHDAAAAIEDAFTAGAAYVQDHSEVDDDGRIALERGASVGRAAEQHVRDHESTSKAAQATATASEVTDHEQTADADRVRAVVVAAVDEAAYRQDLGRSSWSLGFTEWVADRVAAQLTAPPPGHVCPVPYELGPEDVDEIEAARNFVGRHGGFRSTVDVLDKILAAHRAPMPTIEPLPEVIACGTVGCVSSIKKHLLPAGWLLLDGRWRCPRCKVIATSGAS